MKQMKKSNNDEVDNHHHSYHKRKSVTPVRLSSSIALFHSSGTSPINSSRNENYIPKFNQSAKKDNKEENKVSNKSESNKSRTTNRKHFNYDIWRDRSHRHNDIRLAPDRLYINTYLENYDYKFLAPLTKTRSSAAGLDVYERSRRRDNELVLNHSNRRLFQRIIDMDVKTASVSKKNESRESSPESSRQQYYYQSEIKKSRRPLKYENKAIYEKSLHNKLKFNSQNMIAPTIQLTLDSDIFQSIVDSHGKNKNTINTYMAYVKEMTSLTANTEKSAH